MLISCVYLSRCHQNSSLKTKKKSHLQNQVVITISVISWYMTPFIYAFNGDNNNFLKKTLATAGVLQAPRPLPWEAWELLGSCTVSLLPRGLCSSGQRSPLLFLGSAPLPLGPLYIWCFCPNFQSSPKLLKQTCLVKWCSKKSYTNKIHFRVVYTLEYIFCLVGNFVL